MPLCVDEHPVRARQRLEMLKRHRRRARAALLRIRLAQPNDDHAFRTLMDRRARDPLRRRQIERPTQTPLRRLRPEIHYPMLTHARQPSPQLRVHGRARRERRRNNQQRQSRPSTHNSTQRNSPQPHHSPRFSMTVKTMPAPSPQHHYETIKCSSPSGRTLRNPSTLLANRVRAEDRRLLNDPRSLTHYPGQRTSAHELRPGGEAARMLVYLLGDRESAIARRKSARRFQDLVSPVTSS